MTEKNILLINPPYTESVYHRTFMGVGAIQSPTLALATISAPLLKEGYKVEIVDLDFQDVTILDLKDKVRKNKPEFVGITATTPVFPNLLELLKIVKEIDDNIKVVVGGVHTSTFPEEIILSQDIDIVVVGEADFAFLDIVKSDNLQNVKGIYFRQDGKTVKTPPRERIKNLDNLPFPAWQLYDISKYRSTRLIEKRSPGAFLETSRGCLFSCIYCNKNLFGSYFSVKSPQRVIEEIKYLQKTGFKEFHIVDDGFSNDIDRSKEICRRIIKNNIKIPWTLLNGIRVDKIDEELAYLLKKSSCYQVAFGVESGNQSILDKCGKGVKLEAARRAIKLSRKAGLEILCFFMLGLPGETIETMEDTINFARSLDIDLAKFAITMPYPGSPLYRMWDREGYITSKDWSLYLNHNNIEKVYNHPNLEWTDIRKYYRKAYIKFYLRLSFIVKRFFRSITNGDIFYDIAYFLNTKW